MVYHEMEQPMSSDIDTQKQLGNIYSLLAELKDDLKKAKAGHNNVDRLLLEITKRDDRIASLENRLFMMETTMKKCEMKCEQFQRRHFMRVSNNTYQHAAHGSILALTNSDDGFLQQQLGLAETYSSDYTKVFSELASYLKGNIPPISEEEEVENEIAEQRTFTKNIMSKNRKRLGSAKAYLDLTKRRYNLRKKATEKIKGHPGIDFVFADLNCTLCLRLVNGTFVHFSSEDELDRIVKQLNIHLSMSDSPEDTSESEIL